HVTAFLFPKKTSANVYASRKPSGEVKRRIIFDGHTDAAFEWRFSYIGGWALKIMIIGAVSGLLFLFAVSVLNLFGLFGPAAQRALGYIQLIFLPVFAGMLFFIRWDIVVDGANDNLTANYTAMTVIKEMAEKDFRYENTEVCVLLTGSEEAGLRGAKAFAEMNKELTNEVETVIIGLETLHDMDHLAVQLVDLTGTVKNDARVGKLIKEAALKCGMDLPYGGFFPGATNPAAYTQAGIPAASLCGVNHDPQKYYHTREDNFESLNPECIEASMQISIECANLYDEAGGIDKFR
ncbi:MAG: M20/M25/M40 family metallo-hydrolase, partial [Oscillospiraceae bacterium]|nr:M20/M25/M40 family metallo-hydrolase [Oscillospiraceae bacterium]